MLGAIALSFINSRLIPDVLNEMPGKIGLDFDLTELSFGIFGFLLVIMMVLRPEGLLPERTRTRSRCEGHRGGDETGVESARTSTHEATAEPTRPRTGRRSSRRSP